MDEPNTLLGFAKMALVIILLAVQKKRNQMCFLYRKFV